jgi:uncharacterized protein
MAMTTTPLASRSVAQHLDPAVLPKRILSLDGGGVRGILTLQYLQAIETLLRKRYGTPSLVLSDYFDLIGGTSTGAIIAAGLALGFDVTTLSSLYTELATRIFKKPFFRIGAIVPKFDNAALEAALKEAYGADTRFGSDGVLRTGLMVMTKRMNTGSPWPLTNNPRDPYYAPVPGHRRIGNANMVLWQIVRASTAAPHYFRPEQVVVGSWLDPQTRQFTVDYGEFVDGGVSTANNPSLQLLKVALLDGFKLNWRTGAENLLLVSVGTGLASRTRVRTRGFKATAGARAFDALLSIMDDCNADVETMMQWLSKSPTARRINGQLDRLQHDLLTGAPLLQYLRYNVEYEHQWMARHLEIERPQSEFDLLAKMDRPESMRDLATLGQLAAARQIQEEHFPIEVI